MGETETSAIEWLNAGLPLLDTLIWPLAIVILTLMFRETIKALINRVSKINHRGAEFSLPQSSAQDVSTPPALSYQDRLAKIQEPDVREVLARETELIRTDLSKHIQDTKEDPVEVLSLVLAETRMSVHFEKAFRVIFASQLRCLKALRTASSVGIPTSEIETEYYPDLKDFSFKNWLRFLVEAHLVKEIDEKLYITDTGMAFLIYIFKNNLPEHRLTY